MQDWGGTRTKGPAAMAYFKLPFHATKQKDNPSYSFALLGPSIQSNGHSAFNQLHAPKLIDLRFSGPTVSSSPGSTRAIKAAFPCPTRWTSTATASTT